MELVPLSYPVKYALNARFMWLKHGLFPNGKCYDDQDPALIEDIERLNARYGYHAERLKDYSGKEWAGDHADALFGAANAPSVPFNQIRG